jgi:hypothetical protein
MAKRSRHDMSDGLPQGREFSPKRDLLRSIILRPIDEGLFFFKSTFSMCALRSGPPRWQVKRFCLKKLYAVKYPK